MAEKLCFETLFPGHHAAIADLRSADAEFDEICRDFLMLSADHAAMNDGSELVTSDILQDYQETLAGLREEITQALSRAQKL